jgi:hypothetical protein
VRALKHVGIPLALLAGGALGAWLALPRLAAMAFIVRAAKTPGLPGRLARRFTREVAPEPLLGLPTRHGAMPAQLFHPAGRVHRTAILLPGLHKDGIHEERLSRLAGELAASGLQVLTIAPPDLALLRARTFHTSAYATGSARDSWRNLRDGKAGLLRETAIARHRSVRGKTRRTCVAPGGPPPRR